MPCLQIAAVILAAGSASRMGRLKQLIPYRGKPLVCRAVETARDSEFDPVIVVVGAEGDQVQAAIAAYPVDIVVNAGWASGMGSSLVAGIKQVQTSGPDAAGVAVMLADQPLVTAEHLRAMRGQLIRGGVPVVAAEYNGTLGVPAFFKREMFQRLATLPPGAGARVLLRASETAVLPFALPEAASDVDTPEDFAALPI